MRPVQIGPCTRCGSTLEHDQDPLTVLCSECDGSSHCAICGEWIVGSGDSAGAVCPSCRAYLCKIGNTHRHKMNSVHNITQHGVDCRCAGDRCRLGTPKPPPPPPPPMRCVKSTPPPTVEFRPGQEIKGLPAWLVSGVLFGSIGFMMGFLMRGVL